MARTIFIRCAALSLSVTASVGLADGPSNRAEVLSQTDGVAAVSEAAVPGKSMAAARVRPSEKRCFPAIEYDTFPAAGGQNPEERLMADRHASMRAAEVRKLVEATGNDGVLSPVEQRGWQPFFESVLDVEAIYSFFGCAER